MPPASPSPGLPLFFLPFDLGIHHAQADIAHAPYHHARTRPGSPMHPSLVPPLPTQADPTLGQPASSSPDLR